MNVNLKALIGKLNDTCRNAMEAAAGLCLARTHYDVDIEHLVVKLSETTDSDVARIYKYYEVDQPRLMKDLTRALDRLKTGNTRTPALSPRIPSVEARFHRSRRLDGSLRPSAARALGR
jgi:type VI secretion system protein VasG